ncbi:site-specific integrase [candidate division KSB1 bacterium]|nr:site-specific integrase [candidate division KSB1 bacterium]
MVKEHPVTHSKLKPNLVDVLAIRICSATTIESSTDIEEKPTLDYVKLILDSIEGNSIADFRDKASIGLALMGGLRYKRLITTRIRDIDLPKLIVTTNTSGSANEFRDKSNRVCLLVFKDWLIEPVKNWLNYLINELNYKPHDPFFPLINAEKGSNIIRSEKNKPKFITDISTIVNIFKTRMAAAGFPKLHTNYFRQLNYNLAWRCCKTVEELEAVSQNLTPNNPDTTYSFYKNFQPGSRVEIISGIDFSKNYEALIVDLAKKIASSNNKKEKGV